jgi:hypothetical protein
LGATTPAQEKGNTMRKWKVTFYLNGHGMETIIHAPSQSQAITMIKAQYPNASSINAVEIH